MDSFFEKLKKGGEEALEKKKQKEVQKTEPAKPKSWEGKLPIDVYQTDTDIIIQAPIAGVKKGDLDISVENDMVTIKGRREKIAEVEEKNYFLKECFWGPFSREIILPVEADPSRAQATMKLGILTLKIPKVDREKKRKIAIKE